MNSNKGVIRLYVFLTTVITVIATVFRLILGKYYVEAGTGMYKLGLQTPEAFNIFMIISVIVFFAALFLFDIDNMKKDIKGVVVLTEIVALLIAAVLVFSSVVIFKTKDIASVLGTSNPTVIKVRYISAVLAFPAALYYLMIIFATNKNGKGMSVMSFFPVLWSWVFLLGVYFDHSVQMSSPLRVITELSLILLLLYQLMETRALVGKAKPVFYLLISALALVFLCPAFIPSLVDWIKEPKVFNINTLYTFYGVLMAAYILTRLLGYASSYNTKKTRKPRKNDIFTEEEEVETEQQLPVTEFIERVEEPAEEIVEETAEEITDESEEVAEEATEETVEETIEETPEEDEEAEDIKFFDDEE